jgi:hypothetical protein
MGKQNCHFSPCLVVVAAVSVCLCVSQTDKPEAKQRFWQGVLTAGNSSAEKIKLSVCAA